MDRIFIYYSQARIPYSQTHLIEQIGPVERMYKLGEAIRSHAEDACDIVLYSVATVNDATSEIRNKENDRIQGRGTCCEGHERHIGKVLADLSQPSILLAKVVSPFLAKTEFRVSRLHRDPATYRYTMRLIPLIGCRKMCLDWAYLIDHKTVELSTLI